MALSKHISKDFLTAVGQQRVAEQEALKLLCDTFRDIELLSDGNNTPAYDFVVLWSGKPVSIEVKEDFRAASTGNIAVEVARNGKPSGIYKISADYLMIKAHKSNSGFIWLMVRPETVRQMIKRGMYHRIATGAGRGNKQSVALFPAAFFAGFCASFPDWHG